jgi:hypothetical protein
MGKKGLLTKPSFRKLRGYAFDPSLSLKVETAGINDIVYKVQWEELEPGPVGEYLEIIDYDPTVEKYYKPVDLEDSYVLAQDGISPSEGNPQFHQQMVYAVAMTTIKNFERALGRRILWATNLSAINTSEDDYVERLRIYPHALREPNAYYSPMKKALLFGYFGAAPANEALHMNDALVFTCLSHDIIAHEVTHAILDGMHRNYNDATNPDILAFHEAFADIVALFQHFTFPEVLKHQVAKTRGQLESQNLLGQLAQEFGTAIGSYGSLRDALGEIDEDNKWKPKTPNPDDYKTLMEPHARGSILVAAVFDAFLTIYKSRVADLLRIASNGTGILPQGELHPDLINRLASEASKAAGHVLSMCIRAIDYCPPVDLTFGDYLRAIITADIDLVPEDSRDYRIAFIDSFRRRGIYPEGIKTLSEDSLRHTLLNIGVHKEADPSKIIETSNIRIKRDKDTYEQSFRLASQAKITIDEPAETLLYHINEFLREYGDEIKYVSNRKMIFDRTKEYVVGKKNAQGKWEKGLHSKLTMKFSNSSFFARITGLAFIDSYSQYGIRKSAKYDGPSFQIQNLRLVSRVGPNGNQINQVVFSIVQRSGIVFEKDNSSIKYFEPPDYYGDTNVDPETIQKGGFEFTGGCTLIFDLDTLKLKYAISKPLLDFNENDATDSVFINRKRAKEQYQYQNGDDKNGFNEFSMYFGNGINRVAEPFAFLHQH